LWSGAERCIPRGLQIHKCNSKRVNEPGKRLSDSNEVH
jgi:hypothetical protein